MITKLTEEQVKKLPLYRDKGLQIGLSTGPCDRTAVEAAVDESYRSGRLHPPRKIWVGSPFAGMQEAYQQQQQGKKSVVEQVREQVEEQVRSQVRDQVEEQVRDQVEEQVRVKVEDQIWEQVGEPVWAQVWDQVRAQVWAQVWTQVRNLYYTCGDGTQDAPWLGFYEYLGEQCGLAQEIAPLQGLIRYAKAGGGWWWPFADVVVLSERPSKIIRDAEHRLHCEDGPAVVYPDGFAVYAIHGVRMPAWMIMHPEQITPGKILEERNQEIRRVMLHQYGWPRMLRELEASELQRDRFGILYETRRLSEYLDGEDPTARFVFVIDPSTGREYALRVEPTIATAHAGVASTFGLTAAQYHPTQET